MIEKVAETTLKRRKERVVETPKKEHRHRITVASAQVPSREWGFKPGSYRVCVVALEGLLCMLRPSQGADSLNYPFLTAPWKKKEYDTKQLRMKLRKDCLNFLVDNTEQVQKTPGRG